MNKNEMVEMRVENLVFDPLTNTPIIILKDMLNEKSLPIWVGYPEATAIALQMESVTTPRPMTHDLIKNILTSVKASVNYICVNDLKDSTFYAIISIGSGKEEVEVDSRPSDAIAVALRLKVPIYVNQKVLENAKEYEVSPGSEHGGENEDQVKKWLDEIKPSDFGQIDQ
ncbi:MAG: bifunctional nuclease family protein [Nitrospinota bacterium]|nr:bifunctional nuclease family protein [Nitrospinota bacterium]MDH5678823.1 bifunctional nuclease family protein [Nitrospinota bacterium]MDH5756351.1 bifunctional nuclease family protein [Nitrospinota bacterium]